MADEQVVHVIDDDDAVRDSISFLLSTAGITAHAHESAEAFLKAASDGIGCVITDVRMPGMTGLDLIQEMRRRHLAIPVIVITGQGDVPLAVEAMKLGAFDFIEKPFDDETMLEAIRAACSRRRNESAREMRDAEIRQRLDSLSERERQVLDLLVAGQANKVIAGVLGISPRTVEVYRANVMTKMQAASFSDLVRMTLLVGLDPPSA